MEYARDDEVVVQLHVPASQHINLHPRCLHLWRPQGVRLPLPDPAMVGTPASSNWPEQGSARLESLGRRLALAQGVRAGRSAA